MGGIAQVPRISVEFDFETDEYVLKATSYGQTEPAGARLFRAHPPFVQFRHPDRAAADKDTATLQAYLDDYATGKHKNKGAQIEVEARGRGWWED